MNEEAKHTEKLLNEAGMYHFDAYGWEDADTPNSDFKGHYYWAVRPPVDIDYIYNVTWVRNPQRAKPEPDFWTKQLAIKGADFEGLMKAARMTLGLFLREVESSRNNQFYEDSAFDLHYMSAIIYLATAAERIREFFIVAAFKEDQKTYHQRDETQGKFNAEPRSWYATPLKEASKPSLNEEAKEALSKLLLSQETIKELRDQRNILIHELATRIGRTEKLAIERSRNVHEAEDFPWEKVKVMQEESDKIHRAEVNKIITKLSRWYNELIKVSNETFIFEFSQRPKPF